MHNICARSGGHSFVTLLKDCARHKDLKKGSELHSKILNTGLLSKDLFVGCTLVSMYAKCADLAKAQEVFDQLPRRNVVSWNALITGYMNQGYHEKVLCLLDSMQIHGVSPTSVTFICSLKACTSIDAIDKGFELHAEIARRGLLLESSNLCCAVVDMYVHCSLLERAQEVLNKNCGCSVDAWNAMIYGYVKHMQGDQALQCLDQMQLEGIFPDAITFACIINGCASSLTTNAGMNLHAEITKKGLLERDMILGSSLLDMYLKCGLLSEAQKVFEQLAVKDTVTWTTLIKGYLDHDQAFEALEFFRQMQCDEVLMDSVAYLHGMKACGSIRAIADGKLLHAEAEKKGFCHSDLNLFCALISMYCKCGLFAEANTVLGSAPKQDVSLWNALLSGHVDYGLSEEALCCFDHMQSNGIFPDAGTLACYLKACGNIGAIDNGRQLHSIILCKGVLEEDVSISVGNALIDMYGKCGCVQEAHSVLKILPCRDTISWNALIAGYAYLKDSEIADQCFRQMQIEGVCPSFVTFSVILKACRASKAVEHGMEVHAELVSRGLLEEDTYFFLGEMVVDFYANSGCFEEAKNVFVKNPVQSCTGLETLLSAYVELGFETEAVKFLNRINQMRTLGESGMLECSLNIFSIAGTIDECLEFHAEIVRFGFLDIEIVGSKLIHMYMRLSMPAKAQELFDRLLTREVLPWNSLIDGLVKHGLVELGFWCIKQMQQEGVLPDAYTFSGVLKSCCTITDMAKGREIHAVFAGQSHFKQDHKICVALLDMYIKCRWLEEAHGLLKNLSFPNSVYWNVLIAGYNNVKCSEQAVVCFEQMLSGGVSPDSITFACALKACSAFDALSKGREIHADVVGKGLIYNDLSVGNALVYLYARHGYLAEAQNVFQNLPSRDVVSWNTLLTGFLLCDQGDRALNCFKEMQNEGTPSDAVSIVCILKTCGSIGAFGVGQQVHAEVEREGLFNSDTNVVNSLINMYVRCGSMSKAMEIFCSFEGKDFISWNSFIMGYALLGDGKNASEILKRMEEQGVTPDCNTFLGVLYACNHEGSTGRAEAYFCAVCKEQKILATIENLTCIVDLLGRAGQLDRAAIIVREIPFHPDIVISCSLLGACVKWGSVELANHAFKHALLCDEKDFAAHFYMLNIYSGAEMEDRTWL